MNVRPDLNQPSHWRHLLADATLAYTIAYVTDHWQLPLTQHATIIIADTYGIATGLVPVVITTLFFERPTNDDQIISTDVDHLLRTMCQQGLPGDFGHAFWLVVDQRAETVPWPPSLYYRLNRTTV